MQSRSAREAADEAALALLEHLPDPATLYEGADLRVTAMNAAARALSGDLTGQAILEAVPHFHGQQVLERLREVFETGEPFRAEEWRINYLDTAGQMQEAYVNIVAEPLRWSDGSMRGVVTSAALVTDAVLARRAADDVSAELRERTHDAQELLLTLQDELLPDSLPVLPRVEVAASYLLADADSSAGGDWFDAVPLEQDHVALVVGDVVGHGVAASAVMGRLRAVLEERLLAGCGPAEALSALDRFASHDVEAHAATVCVVDLDLHSGRMRYCTAGHPPPLVVAADGTAAYLPASGAGPLACGRPYAEAGHVLEQRSVLLLYTDGIVERPGRTVSQNTVELLTTAGDAVLGRGLVVGAAEHAVDRVILHPLELLTRMTGFADDITLLAAQRRPPPGPLEMRLPAVADSLRPALTSVMAWLEGQRVRSHDVMAIAHAAGELVSNVIDHAYRDRETVPEEEIMAISVALTGDGCARVEIADGGAWRDQPAGGDRGRGLAMASGLVDRLDLDRRSDGTTARITHQLHRHVELLTDVSGVRPARGPRSADLVCDLEEGRLVVRGPVDRVSADAFRSALRQASRGGVLPLTVDLSGVTRLASAGVQALAEALTAAEDGHGELRLLAEPGSNAQHVLDLARLPYLAPSGPWPAPPSF
ncbi:MAG TPA: SpoIIE family protein phosphatase [Marmoricola sp.]|nr:SpoIIE family protein phosphatase [Marmoricola sp.]